MKKNAMCACGTEKGSCCGEGSADHACAMTSAGCCGSPHGSCHKSMWFTFGIVVMSVWIGSYIQTQYNAIQSHRAAIGCRDEAIQTLTESVPVDESQQDDAMLREPKFFEARGNYSMCLLENGIDPRTVPTFADIFSPPSNEELDYYYSNADVGAVSTDEFAGDTTTSEGSQ